MPPADLDDGLALNVSDLKEMISQVAFAASTDDARPVLTGVQAEIDSGELTLAAADGFRLSVRSAHLPSPTGGRVRAIIPARALAELGRILADGEEVVNMSLPANRSQVDLPHQEHRAGLAADRRHLPGLPQHHPNRVFIAHRRSRPVGFLKACKAADIFAREAAHSARLRITPGTDLEPGNVEITATSAETGSNETIVEATVEGEANRNRLQRQLPGGRAGRHRHPECGGGDDQQHLTRRHPTGGAGRFSARRDAHAPRALSRPSLSQKTDRAGFPGETQPVLFRPLATA